PILVQTGLLFPVFLPSGGKISLTVMHILHHIIFQFFYRTKLCLRSLEITELCCNLFSISVSLISVNKHFQKPAVLVRHGRLDTGIADSIIPLPVNLYPAGIYAEAGQDLILLGLDIHSRKSKRTSELLPVPYDPGQPVGISEQ